MKKEIHKQPIKTYIRNEGGVVLKGVKFTLEQNTIVSNMLLTVFFLGALVGVAIGVGIAVMGR